MATNEETSHLKLVDSFGESPDILRHWFRFSVNREAVEECYQRGMSAADISQAITRVVEAQVYARLAMYQTAQRIVFPPKAEPEKL